MRPPARPPLLQHAACVALAAALSCGVAPAAYAADVPAGETMLAGSTIAAIDPTPIGSDAELEARTPTLLSATGGDAALLSEPTAAKPTVCATPYLQPSPEARASLARSLAGPRARAASEPQVGDTRPFHSDYRAGEADFAIECVDVGENYTFWMDAERLDAIAPQDLAFLAESLHEHIDREVELFGDWREGADVDGDGRAAFVFYPFLEEYDSVLGFFISGDLYDGGDDYVTGNVMDALHVNSGRLYEDPSAHGGFDADLALATLVHEFQHLINHARTGGYSDAWLNEAFSQAAVGLAGITTDDPALLAVDASDLGYLPPFVYEDDYTPGVERPEAASSYGAWFLFGLYLASQTEGFASPDGSMSGGEGVYRAVLGALSETDEEGTYDTCTRDALIAALGEIGYLGEEEGCVVRDFDELVANFGMAFLLREETGPRSLSGDPAARSTVCGSDVPLAHFDAPAASIPGGGALTAVDVEGGSFAVDAEADPRIVYASGDAPLPVSSRVLFEPDGGPLAEGDPISLSFSHGAPGGQLLYCEAADGQYVHPSTYRRYEGPLAATAGSYRIRGSYRCEAGTTLTFRSGLFAVAAREEGEEGPAEQPAVPPENAAGPSTPSKLPAPQALAPTGDPLAAAIVDAAALACLAAALAAASRRRAACARKVAKR